ncbi:YhcH/YjgK/YiaL family protein [Rahnella bruchi]|uniref:YhcH/YjgK/YiaL family protein n=1 Tax=Rahnella bruchi TaxID=1510573 RepID=UPI000EA32F22|nr:YhcH/YjgK/YiaL family protein [Rahnella bruchi]
MITGNLGALELATLPAALLRILMRPECSLEALCAREDGRFQPPGAEWFCNIGNANTSPAAERHTEFHREWLDIQVVLEGEEIIGFDTQNATGQSAVERKPDLYILDNPELVNEILLRSGDFVTFAPGEPHRALCCIRHPAVIRKAVFKVPASSLKE